MSDQDGINWDALAKAGFVGFFGSDDDWAEEPAKHLWERETRAVVAAYVEQRAAQGFVEVRRSTGRPATPKPNAG